jgi:hypothetical protein
MTTGKVKRSEIKTFLNTTPSTTATYVLIGDGVASGKISYAPETSKETYINADNAAVRVESYAPTMAIEMVAKNGDAVFEYIDAMRKARAILDAAETDIVNVWAYETGGPTAYPAEKQPVSIQIDEFGGDGGKAAKISYTLNYNGTPSLGTYNANTGVFTAS